MGWKSRKRKCGGFVSCQVPPAPEEEDGRPLLLPGTRVPSYPRMPSSLSHVGDVHRQALSPSRVVEVLPALRIFEKCTEVPLKPRGLAARRWHSPEQWHRPGDSPPALAQASPKGPCAGTGRMVSEPTSPSSNEK